ncbi:PREDICTED: monoacylglycerol lipase ABHD6-like [Amphimedon queenslandica]|uniref:acylglycerol lipase n=1 Tax=Amphimedon queenslandica TaxID=400682 RepID=A0A1X7VXI8_AMPQE|nr:PREDICTED: monoacylglycerol lipase ABHD6-like [Amphimedon queenslandica]|eukprot:XP_003382440.1 PREDICTED: monoacylglycerol lipase ABHD6-like [Amphimedon queenslandica]
MAVRVLLHFIVGLIFWPFAVPMGFILGFLYTFYPSTLVNGFLKYGCYLTVPGFTSQSVEIDGIQISYLDRPGSPNIPDTPTVVFIHGFTSQKLGWVPLIRFLPASWRIIAIDLPGHGESGVADDWDCSVKNIGSLLHKVFTSIGLTQFHIIGESLGSAYSGQYAADHPEMINSIILMCPPIFHRLKGAPCTPAMEAIDGPNSEKNPLLPTNPEEFRSMLELVLYKSNGNLLHDHMLEAVVGVHSKHYDNFRRVLHDVKNGGDTEEEIKARIEKSNNIPSMVLWGREDQICAVAGAKLIKRLSPKCKVIVINNCGHCMSVERPKKCAQFIEQFISRQQATS